MKYILEYDGFNVLTTEEQEIKDKAITDGTFMKAPNGRKTKLSEKQWLQVKTKNFINWFGDWINDPENASKIVDENGEPLILIHRSNSDIEIFTKQKPVNGTVLGNGYYFSNRDVYKEYGNIKYEVYLNIKSPYNLTSNKRDRVPLNKYTKIYGETNNEYIIGKLNGAGFGLIDLQGYKNDENLIEKIGFDGIIYNEQYKVNHSEQIKSATNNNGDFNPNDKNINK